RLEADYADLIESSLEAASECSVQAENFLRQIKEYLEKL
ncbi:MAG: hypothetical protein RLZZ597_2883, partial [Cyanobacteriota bacterium]